MTQSLEEQVAHLQLMLSVMSCRIQDLENDLRSRIEQLANNPIFIRSIDDKFPADAAMSKYAAQAKLNQLESQVDQFQKEYIDWAGAAAEEAARSFFKSP